MDRGCGGCLYYILLLECVTTGEEKGTQLPSAWLPRGVDVSKASRRRQ